MSRHLTLPSAALAFALLSCLSQSPTEPAAIATTPAQTESPTAAIVPSATLKPSPTQRPSPTPTPDPAQAELDALQSDGLVPMADGKILHIPTFSYQHAEQSYSYWYPVEAIPGTSQDYVLSSDVSWEIGSERATWFWAGCGFFVRPENADGEYGYFVERTADGFIWLNLWDPGKPYLVDLLRPDLTWDDYFAMGRPGEKAGSVHLVLILRGKTLRLLSDGEEALYRDDIVARAGEVGVMVGSGTNQGLGTRCTFSNMWFFNLDGVSPSSGG